MAKAATAKRAPRAEPEEIDPISNDDSLQVIELDENLDDVPEPVLLPPGYYTAELQNVTVRNNQKGTGRYYAIEFVIPPDQFPADYEADNYADGMKCYYNLLRVPAAGDRRAIHNIRRFMQKLGLATDTPTIDPNLWMGQRVKLKIEHGTYEGVTREQIARNGIEAL